MAHTTSSTAAYFSCPVSAPSTTPSLSSSLTQRQGLPSPTSPLLTTIAVPSTSLPPSHMEPFSVASSETTFLDTSDPMSPTSLSPSISHKKRRSPSPLPPSHAISLPYRNPASTHSKIRRSSTQSHQNVSLVSTSSLTLASTELAVAAPEEQGFQCQSRTPSSTSTPPPSPPLATAAPSRSPSPTNDTSDKQPSIPSSVSTAAAAAASCYTSQELAIAYSMVTSTQQEQDPVTAEEDNQIRGTTALSSALPLAPKKSLTPVESADALSSLWKKTVPSQEPYFRTRHAIASQHTLSTLGGALFSLDEEQKEFTTDMYVAMRNRIFELEAKTVNYAPFNRASQKRPVEPSWISDDYQYTGPHQRQRGHDSCSMDADTSHPSKRPAYHHITHHHPPHPEHLPVTANAMGSSGSVRAYQGLVYKHISSYPSWYAPEAYISHHRPYSSQLPTRYPQTIERELEQQHRQPRTCKVQASLAYQEQEIPSASGRQSPVSIVHSPPKPTRRPSTPSNHPTQPQVIQPRPILPNMETTVHTNSNRSPPSHPRSHPSPQGAASAAAAAAAQQRQSFHQRQHRAQQQAQSDYSRSYHLQKHMRMMDQKRASQLAQQQQQQQQSHTAIFMSNQRHYQPHQQMYSSSSVKPTATLQPHSGASSLQTISQQQAHQHRLMQHQQQRQLHLQLQQQQARQLQYLRQRGLVNGSTASPASDSPKMAPASSTPSLKVTRSEPSPAIEPKCVKKSTNRPLECFNCMALDSLTWRPRIVSDASSSSLASRLTPVQEGRYLCTPCLHYHQANGHCRPVPPFKVNFLRKIHCRFKKELQEVRFQGWQDAQVLEIEDQIALQDFESVFEGLDGNILASTTDSLSDPTDTVSETNLRNLLSPVMEEREDRVVIKIEDSDEEGSPLIIKSPSRSAVQEKVKDSTKHTFQNEASVGELFGHRWKTEPMVGYTLVQFGGTDRTRMVPMNPTVPSLTVTFNAVSESITFAFRVLVNGLCLLTSGGGPPALHMPEVSDESEDSDRDEELQESNPNEKDTARAGSPTKSPVEAEDIPTTIDKQKTDLGE